MDVVTLQELVKELAGPRAGVQVRALALSRVLAVAAAQRVSLPLGVTDYFMTAGDADRIRAAYPSTYSR